MNPDHASLLKRMLEQELITAAQERRVRRALERGASLEEALGRTPLVDPLDYQKLLRQPGEAGVTAPDRTNRIPQRSEVAGIASAGIYDLAENEGIPLLIRLHDLLGEFFYGGLGGIELGREEMSRGWSRLFDARGEWMDARPLDPVQAEKMMARLRVMARLSPSDKSPRRSAFGLVGNGLSGEVLVESQGDVVRLVLYRA
jgi:hypothetical protein